MAEMDEKDIITKFEGLLSDVNLSEGKKNILRDSSVQYKQKMLLQYKSAKEYRELNEFSTPQHYIDFLETHSRANSPDPDKILYCIESLRIALASYPVSWLHEFGYKGLSILCNILDLSICETGALFHKIQIECLKCILKFINTTEDIRQSLKHDSSIVVIVGCINYSKTDATIIALQLITSLCTVSDEELKSNLRNKIMSSLSTIKQEQGTEQFKPIVDCITLTENEDLWVHALRLINAVLFLSDDVEIRTGLREEILKCGLQDKMEALRNASNINVSMLAKDFDRQQIEDELENELKERFQNMKP